MTTDYDKLLMGGGGPKSLQFTDEVQARNRWIICEVIETPEIRQATEFKRDGTPGAFKFWKRNGVQTQDPIMSVVCVVQTGERNHGPEDDGKRRLWLEQGKDLFKAVSAAVAEATAHLPKDDQGIRVGGKIAVCWYGEEAVEGVETKKKLFKASYQLPTVRMPSGPTSDPFGGTPAAPAAVTPTAPPAAPNPDPWGSAPASAGTATTPPTVAPGPFDAAHTAQPGASPFEQAAPPPPAAPTYTPAALAGAQGQIAAATSVDALTQIAALWRQHFGAPPPELNAALSSRATALAAPPPPPVAADPFSGGQQAPPAANPFG